MYHLSTKLRLKKFWLHNSWCGALVVWIVAAVVYTWWTSPATFADPDSFYHLKIVEIMIKTRRAVVDFPWLQFTTLKDAYVDHHFLYHVLVVPFVWIFGSVLGMKVATVFLAASAVTMFYGLLRFLGVRGAGIFTVLLLFTEAFSLRMALAKAPSVGFLFLVGAFWLMVAQQWRSLLVLSFFYVWAYGGFLLLVVLAAVYSGFLWLEQRGRSTNDQKDPRRVGGWGRIVAFWHAARYLMVSVGGLAAGLAVHPSFPQHLKFYWQQVVQIGLVNYQQLIGVGAEWYPLSADVLFGSLHLVNVLAALAVVVFFITWRRQNALSKTAGLMMLVFFAFTLKSRRYVEYYVPWAYLFVALSGQNAGAWNEIKLVVHSARRLWWKEWNTRLLVTLGLVYALVIVPGILVIEAGRLYATMKEGIPVSRFAAAGEWLRAHSSKGDIIFHDDWDNFPALFYRVAKVNYIVGLDPTFMYNYNRDLYWKWRKVTAGEFGGDEAYKIIKNDFKARFVVVDSDHTAMLKNIEQDERLARVYSDDELTVFRVPR